MFGTSVKTYQTTQFQQYSPSFARHHSLKLQGTKCFLVAESTLASAFGVLTSSTLLKMGGIYVGNDEQRRPQIIIQYDPQTCMLVCFPTPDKKRSTGGPTRSPAISSLLLFQVAFGQPSNVDESTATATGCPKSRFQSILGKYQQRR